MKFHFNGPHHFELTIPMRLISEANSSDHWAVKRKRRQSIDYYFLMHWNVKSPKILLPCVVQLSRYAPRGLDEDNLIHAFKGLKDTIADKIIPGLAKGRADGSKEICWEYYQFRTKDKKYAISIHICSQQADSPIPEAHEPLEQASHDAQT